MSDVGSHFERGLELIRARSFFEAHEELELAWRAAPAEERDFFQGLVHVAVAWYQAGRGEPVRLRAPAREGGATARAVRAGASRRRRRGRARAGRRRAGDGRRGLARARAAARLEEVPEAGAQPPQLPEEEQQPEDDEDDPADDLDVAVVVAEPAERSHRRPEHDAGQDERDGEAERVREEQERSLADRARGPPRARASTRGSG